MFSDQNCLTISEHLQLTVMEPLVLLRLELESLLQVLELWWLLHKQLLILRMLECHTLELHRLVRNTWVRMDHTLASNSSAWEASVLAA